MSGQEHLRFGKFHLLQRIATGGMGEVHLAKLKGPSGFEKLVVIKRLLENRQTKKHYIDMFFSEARVAAQLNHSNIVQIYEVGQIDGVHYIAMEYVQGKSWRRALDAAFEKYGFFPPAHTIKIISDLCNGLSFAHDARHLSGAPMDLIHRDINPHNILLSYRGEVKVIDFGIAKSELTLEKTQAGTIKGTVVYMSPEQASGKRLDKRSDLFSVGICLYEALSGENPFYRDNVSSSLEAIRRSDHPALELKHPELAVFTPILTRALATQPAERYADCSELGRDLRELLERNLIAPASVSLQNYLQALFAQDIAAEERLLGQTELAEVFSPTLLPNTPQLPDLQDEPTPIETMPGAMAEAMAAAANTAQNHHDAPTLMAPNPLEAEEETALNEQSDASVVTLDRWRLPPVPPTPAPARPSSGLQAFWARALQQQGTAKLWARQVQDLLQQGRQRLQQLQRRWQPYGQRFWRALTPQRRFYAALGAAVLSCYGLVWYVLRPAPNVVPVPNPVGDVAPVKRASDSGQAPEVGTLPSATRDAPTTPEIGTDSDAPSATGESDGSRHNRAAAPPGANIPVLTAGGNRRRLGHAGRESSGSLGSLQVQVEPPVPTLLNHQRLGSAPIRLLKGSGNLQIGTGRDPQVDPFAVRLRYRLEGHTLTYYVESEPWAHVLGAGGMTLGRTPLEGVAETGTLSLELRNPRRAAALHISVRFTP